MPSGPGSEVTGPLCPPVRRPAAVPDNHEVLTDFARPCDASVPHTPPLPDALAFITVVYGAIASLCSIRLSKGIPMLAGTE